MSEVNELKKEILFLKRVIVEIACKNIDDQKILTLMTSIEQDEKWEESYPIKE